MGTGVAVFVNDIYRPDLDFYKMEGSNGTNNIGEWLGLVAALEVATKLSKSKEFFDVDFSISLYGDSQLVVRQYNGIYRIKEDTFRPMMRQAKELAFGLGNRLKVIEWIPRGQNKEADRLSKKAIREFLVENNMI